ncbi:unnamed protein product [Paramecium primaurelia]|uniref:Uncharacterized protein n=1 Tax=Paramecium primaurelia TaxID=5886 RepID=A0A8S1QSK8_PARPR|nr:unnamed protein product [Paramecium primaurelia]
MKFFICSLDLIILIIERFNKIQIQIQVYIIIGCIDFIKNNSLRKQIHYFTRNRQD